MMVVTLKFCNHVLDQLLFNDDDKQYSTIPVFSYIPPTMKTSFMLHYIIYEGQLETDINLILHEKIRECFRYCTLIGPNNDEDSLIGYEKQLT